MLIIVFIIDLFSRRPLSVICAVCFICDTVYSFSPDIDGSPSISSTIHYARSMATWADVTASPALFAHLPVGTARFATRATGFLLDGGVHQTALLRTVLPNPPASILSCSSLHRTHLPPHDTVLALALPSPSSSTPPHGPATKLNALFSTSDIPTSLGNSSAQGTILLTFATPDLSGEKKQSNGLVVTTTNAQVTVESKGGKWVVSVAGSKGSGVEDAVKEGKSEGVEVEVGMFARAVAAVKEGKGGDGGEKNHGEPRGAMWDLAVIEACLTSEGKSVDLERLIAGK